MKISTNILIVLWLGVVALLTIQCYVLFKKDRITNEVNFKSYDEVAIYHESDDILAYNKDTELYLEERIGYNVLHYYVFEKGEVIGIHRDTIWDKIE